MENQDVPMTCLPLVIPAISGQASGARAGIPVGPASVPVTRRQGRRRYSPAFAGVTVLFSRIGQNFWQRV